MAKNEESRQDNLRGEQLGIFLGGVGRRGLAAAVYRQVRDLVVEGRLTAGTRLPSSRDLAVHLGVSRHTVASAYEQLTAEGYVVGRRGGGTVVSDLRWTADTRSPTTASTDSSATGQQVPVEFDLRPGSPDLSLFPMREWRRCVVDAAESAPGDYGDPLGEPDVRHALASWLGRSRGLVADASSVVVTSGAQHAISLVLAAVVEPGARVAVEDPGYPIVRALCADAGYRVVGVPVDADGMIVDLIPDDVAAVVVTPAHQYPLGGVMSMARRLGLIAHAARTGAIVVEDDYDSEYRHEARPLEPLHRVDGGDHVAYVHSFSKTLAPSLRLGVLVAPPPVVARVRDHRRLHDGQPPRLLQDALRQFVDGGHQDRHLRRTRRIYRERHALVGAHVERWLAAGTIAASVPTSAGLHVTVTLPSGADEDEVVDDLADRGVAVDRLRPCWVDIHAADERAPGFVIGFGRIGDERLSRALDLIGEAVTSARRREAGAQPSSDATSSTS